MGEEQADNLSNQSLKVLEKKLRNLKMEIESGRVSEHQIKSFLESILNGYLMVPAMTTIRGAWRARRHEPNTCFNDVSELWYPPAQFIKSPGRLNRVSQPRFYCAPQRNFAAHEVCANPGDLVTVLAVEPRKVSHQFALVPLGVDRCSPDALTVLRWVPVRQNPYLQSRLGSPEALAEWCQVDDFLADILTMKIPVGAEERYYVTNFLAEATLSLRDKLGGMDGILYPSVATKLNAFNFCFTAETADTHFKPVTAHVFKVTRERRIGDEKVLDTTLIASSRLISDSGKITWIPAPKRIEDSQTYFANVCGPLWARGLEMKFGDE